MIRDGAVAEVSTRALVPGDLIVLTAGRVVPADVRLITGLFFGIDLSLEKKNVFLFLYFGKRFGRAFYEICFFFLPFFIMCLFCW